MKLENYIIGIIVFSMFVGIFALAISDVNTKYNITIEDDWADNYNKMDDVRTNTEQMKDYILANESVSKTEQYISFFQGAFKAVLSVFTITPLAFGIITTASEQFGIPPIIFWGVTTILLILVIFAVIKLLRNN